MRREREEEGGQIRERGGGREEEGSGSDRNPSREFLSRYRRPLLKSPDSATNQMTTSFDRRGPPPASARRRTTTHLVQIRNLTQGFPPK